MRTPTRKDRDRTLDLGALQPFPEPDEHALQDLPMVAIVGRPNVGKSTLFNRIIGRRKAVVHDRPGVTRDRNVERAEWDGLPFLCVDTGGFDVELEDPLLLSVVEQVRIAIDEADAIILLFAVDEADHPADAEIIEQLRDVNKPVAVAINKCDNPHRELEAVEFYKYGLDRLFPLSAVHGHGTADLMSQVLDDLRNLSPKPRPARFATGIRLAIVGRQNVGKSTMINHLAGAERVIAAPLPGTTRDAIDTPIAAPDGTLFTLVDTAGIRRRGKIEYGVERLSVLSAMVSLRRADVAAVVIDAAEGLTEQDAHIAGYCLDMGRATMILVNKWDLVEKDHRTADQFRTILEREWPFMRWAPVIFTAGLTGQRTQRIFDVAERIHANARRRIRTHELNEHLQQWVTRRPPPMQRNRRPKVRFMTQSAVAPPTFILFVNEPRLFHFSYRRHLTNRIRETWDFEGTPIRLRLRPSAKPREGDLA